MPRKKNERQYASDNKLIMERWDFQKNKMLGLDPSKITDGSHIKAHFICPKCKNEWFGEIRYVKKYQGGCSTCAEEKRRQRWMLDKMEKSVPLFISNPELEKEWDFELNSSKGLNPLMLVSGSNKCAHWICPLGHKYEALIVNRARKNTGCTYCAGQAVLEGFNDFASMRPDLLEEWDYELNEAEAINPTEYTCGSNKIVHWICPIGHRYKRSIKARNIGRNCSVCGKGAQTSLPEQAVFYYVKMYFPDAENRYKFDGKMEIDIFIPSLKIGIEYDGVYYHKSEKKEAEERKDKYITSKGIEIYRVKEVNDILENSNNEKIIYVKESSTYQYLNKAISILLSLLNIEDSNVDVKRDIINIYSLYLNTIKENSVAVNLCLMAEWDKEKNDNINPQAVSNNSNIKIWWRCNLGHSYQASPKHRNQNTGCPYCAGKKVLKGFNDLKSYAEQKMNCLIDEWDYQTNTSKMDEVYFGSTSNYNWKCPKCSRTYERTAYARVRGMGCPYCNHKKVDKELSFGYLHPEILIDWNYQLNEISPYEVAEFSNKCVFWKCHICGNEMKASISSRAKGFRCNVCSVRKTRQGSHATRIKKRGSLSENRSKLIDDWDFDKNDLLQIYPDKVTCGSGSKVWWRCGKCGHNWEDTINARNKGKMCPNCRYTPYPKPRKEVSDEQKRAHQRKVQENAAKTRLRERGSLRDNRPLLIRDWDFDKNDLINITPDDITIGSKIVVWWKCSECSYSWEDMVQSRSYGKKCPSCGYTHYPNIRRRGGNS